MKTIYVLILFASVQTLFSQPYNIRVYTIGAPGGNSAKNGYALKGTLGMHDAFHSSGGTFSLNAGFWQAATLPKGPKLRIVAGGRTVLIAWPDPSTGFQLQQSGDLSPASWSDVTVTPRLVGTERQVVVPIQSKPQFFRLRKADTR